MTSPTNNSDNVSTTIPKTHAAWTFTRAGDPTQILSLRSDMPTPDPTLLKQGEALIKVSAVSLNAGMLGIMKFPHLTSRPWVPELEFAGSIVALPPAAQGGGGGSNPSSKPGDTAGAGTSAKLQVGDKVVGARSFPDLFKYNGTLQEYVVSPVGQLGKVSESLGLNEASGLPAVGCTALQALKLAGVKKGDKVLITAASGGLGTMLVQVARVVVGKDGIVVGSCSGRNEELVRGLGADETIDYTTHSPLHGYLAQHHSSKKFDAIFDVAGTSNDLFTHSPSYLVENGTFVLLGNMNLFKPSASFFSFLIWALGTNMNRYLPRLLGGIPRKFCFYSASPTGDDTRKIIEMAEKGEVKPAVDSVWKWEDAIKAYERAKSQRARGKIIIEVE
ncbi:Trans-enoyl reductase poxH [Exophiala dermatitidis]